jgi:glutamate carboxypeptidase
VGLRFTDPQAERRVLRAITGAAPHRTGAVVVAELLSTRPTWAPPAANPLLDSVVATAADLGQQVTGRPAAGGGDTNFTGSAGLPTLDGLGPVGSGAHAVDEHILVSSLAERAALLAAILVRGVPPRR